MAVFCYQSIDGGDRARAHFTENPLSLQIEERRIMVMAGH